MGRLITWSNLGLCVMLCLGSYLTHRFHAGEEGFDGYAVLLLVPGVMFGVCSVVRQGWRTYRGEWGSWRG